jgi:hypothetical protein
MWRYLITTSPCTRLTEFMTCWRLIKTGCNNLVLSTLFIAFNNIVQHCWVWISLQSGVTMLNNIVVNYEQCGQHNIVASCFHQPWTSHNFWLRSKYSAQHLLLLQQYYYNKIQAIKSLSGKMGRLWRVWMYQVLFGRLREHPHAKNSFLDHLKLSRQIAEKL